MLIQEIRARMALREKYGTDNFTITIDHSKPLTIIDGKEYGLIFTKSIFNITACKNIGKLFVGIKTPNRERFLSQFPDAVIEYTDRGRNEAIKGYDTEYFNKMASACFALCPNGDFVWTYRFFEACIFGAIPIIEEYCNAYDGYKFYYAGDDYDYNSAFVAHNRRKTFNDMTL